MRLTIDNPEEPGDYNLAVRAFMEVRANNPDQPIGNGGAIEMDVQNRPFVVVRNQDSYTVRIGRIEEETGLEGFPV